MLLRVPKHVGSAAWVFVLAGKILLFEWMKNRKKSCLTRLLVFLSHKSVISELSRFLFVILRVIALLRVIRKKRKRKEKKTFS